MMALSLGLILLSGWLISMLLEKIRIPGLVGMILVGLLFGPYCLNLIDSSILNISSELRQIALVIILTRSGLNLDLASLRKIGLPAALMCFVPACFEIAAVTLAAHFLLGLELAESLLLGSVLAAVSPAVVSPRMIKLIEGGYGEEHNVPKLVLAGSSVDDIFVIVLFYAFLGLNQSGVLDGGAIAMIPVSIVLGIALGIAVGLILAFLIKKISLPLWAEILLMLSSSFLMIGLENILEEWISISSLLGIMVMAMSVLFINKEKSKEISGGYNVLWKFFEIILFVLVGAAVDLSYLGEKALLALLVLLIGLLFRSIGVLLSISMAKLSWKERVFCFISYLPKATVQASIGGIALSAGLGCGASILTISVLSVLVTAPIGAILIDNLGKRLLAKKEGI